MRSTCWARSARWSWCYWIAASSSTPAPASPRSRRRMRGGKNRMSKLGCTCGHVIRDQTDFLPYKGRLLRDYDLEAVYDAIERECEALIAAVVVGDRESWLRRHFLEMYPRDLPNGAVFHDFVCGLLREFMDDVYECEACGRLWVQ